MSRQPVIRVQSLGKRYTLGVQEQAYQTFREAVSESCRRLLPSRARRSARACSRPGHVWALRDVSLEIQQGEAVGIIGRNGAGKSTLLRVLSRITEPTLGRVEIRGRVGSLLEVGTGFHPELTGRENVFLNGAILGMRKAEIDRKFDEIVSFAELETFIDTPVKRYSSGMYMRLAFAVAAHLESEILLIDEVLAVGDLTFQKKCLGKMGEAARAGRTVLFVSHNLEAVSTLTQRGFVLSHGRCVYQGPTPDALLEYQRRCQKEEPVYTDPGPATGAKIQRIELRTSAAGNIQFNGDPMEIACEIQTPFPINGACLSVQIHNALHSPVLHVWTFDSERPMCREPGTFRLTCRIPKLRLYMGRYSLNVYFSERPGGQRFQFIEDVCPFEVVMYGRTHDFGWQPGAAAYLEDCDWEIEKTAEHPAA